MSDITGTICYIVWFYHIGHYGS